MRIVIHPVPLSTIADIVTAIFGFLFLLFFIAVAAVIVLVLLIIKALPFIIGLIIGFVSVLADADDTEIDSTGHSSQKASSASTDIGSTAPGSRHARSETIGSDGLKESYEINEYGELVEK